MRILGFAARAYSTDYGSDNECSFNDDLEKKCSYEQILKLLVLLQINQDITNQPLRMYDNSWSLGNTFISYLAMRARPFDLHAIGEDIGILN